MADDIIEIAEQWEGDVAATAAELSVQVHGEQLFGGDVALEKAKEVRALREALVGAGLAPEATSLAGLRAHVTTGLFTRSSSAYYTLTVRVDDLSLLTGALDAVVAAKQATLLGIRWIYEPSEEVVGEWLARCAARARHAADSLAGALGAEVTGVKHCRSEVLGRDRLQPDMVHFHALGAGAPARARMSSMSAALDEDGYGGAAELAPTRRMGVRVDVGFRIGAAPR